MNPHVDLSQLRTTSGGKASPFGKSPLVSPPRRFVSRVLVPSGLLLGFGAVFAYALQDAVVPTTEVEIIQPVVMASGIATEPSPADATFTTSGASSGTQLFQAPGWIEPSPFPIVVTARQSGVVTQVHAREGLVLAAGDVVAELDSDLARVKVLKAEADVRVMRANATAAQQTWQNPVSLQESLATAQAEKNRIEAERKRVVLQRDHARRLAKASAVLGSRGVESVLATDKAETEADASDATLAELDAKIAIQNATIAAAQSNLKLRIEDRQRVDLANAQLAKAEAELAEATLELKRCRIEAPTSGTVMRLLVKPGSMVSMDVEKSAEILTMYQPTELQVRAEVPMSDANKVRVGLATKVRVEAIPDNSFRGELVRIVHEADVQRNSLPVKVRILDGHPTLKPEMVARVEFFAPENPESVSVKDTIADNGNLANGQTASAVMVPESLLTGVVGQSVKLWLMNEEKRAVEREVTIGAFTQRGFREVSSGLQPADKVVLRASRPLTPGARLTIAERKETNS